MDELTNVRLVTILQASYNTLKSHGHGPCCQGRKKPHEAFQRSHGLEWCRVPTEQLTPEWFIKIQLCYSSGIAHCLCSDLYATLCFVLFCFVLFCFCVTKTAKHVSLSFGIPIFWAIVPYAHLSQKEFSRPSNLNYTRFYFMAVRDQLLSFWCSWPMAMVHILPKVLSSAVGHTSSLDGLTLPCHRQFLRHC